MNKGLIFTIEALFTLGLLAVILFSPTVFETKNTDLFSSKQTIQSTTAGYLDKNTINPIKENYYCQVVSKYDIKSKTFIDKNSCSGFS